MSEAYLLFQAAGKNRGIGFVEEDKDGSRLCLGEGMRNSGIVVLAEVFQLSLSY